MTFQLSLRGKLLCMIALLLAVFCLSLSLYLNTIFSERFTEELLERGRSIARNVAEMSAGAFIEQDFTHLQTIAREHQAQEKNLVYILMLNTSDHVVAHSFDNGYPARLAEIKYGTNGSQALIQKIRFGDILLYDIAEKVMDARVGCVRVGLSAEPALAAAQTMTRQVAMVAVLLCLVLFVIAQSILEKIIRPITALTHASRRIARGVWDVQLPMARDDEIGRLTAAFRKMVSTVQESEKQLAGHASFLQALLDDIPLPVFYTDVNGVMLGCNRAFGNFWGKTSEELIGKHPGALSGGEDAALHLKKSREVIARQTPLSYELQVVDAKGHARDVIYSKACYSDAQGSPTGVIGVILDMTEQRRVDRMKNEFVSTVAHEFQTPLTTILGFAELLKDKQVPEQDRENAYAMIIEKAEVLSKLVDELLDLARIETGKGLSIDPEPCNARELLSALVNNFGKRTPSHRFALELSEANMTVMADTVRIGQVMENLLSNAVKYSHPNSQILIDVTADGNECRVRVCDEGIGIKPYHLDKVFDRYYRVDSSNTAPAGTGLGLYITRSIIGAHHGRITIDSVPAQGTTVTFHLPLNKH